MQGNNSHPRLTKRRLLKMTAGLGAAGVGLTATSGSAAAVEVGETDQWTREEASRIELTDDTTAPLIDHDPERLLDDYWVWDTWPLRNRDGEVVKVDGWQIIFSLTAPSDLVPGDRHNAATIRYFYSRNGYEWQGGAKAFDYPLGHHQWAGAAMYDEEEGQIYHFYTAVSSAPEFRQRPALGKGASIETGPDGVELTGEQEHIIMASPDGEMYQTLEQSREQGIVYAFRDPWYFKHPETGEDLAVFEANTPTGSTDPTAPESFNGNIGLMRATNDELTEWELLPPIVEAIGTNQQLERPHFIFQDGKWYLFTISHQFTFAPGLSGPDALYGFVGDSLYGDYEPLNGSGLVVANPPEAPFQAYSWLAMPHGDNAIVESFENFRGLDETSIGEIGLDEVGYLLPDEQRDLFGGTLAPSLKLQLDGTETRIVSELRDGEFISTASASSDGGEGDGDQEQYYQIDFVAGEPIEELGEDGLYADQDRLLRFAFVTPGEGITERGSAWASADVRECLPNYGHIISKSDDTEYGYGRTDNEVGVTFTVADGCELTLTLAVHSMPGATFDRETAEQQELMEATTEQFGPGTHLLTVELPTEEGSDE